MKYADFSEPVNNWSKQMQVKETAKQLIDKLPEESTMDDIIHALYIKLKFEHGENQIRQNKGVPHHEAKQRLNKWLK